MSLLAHTTYGAPGFKSERHQLHQVIQQEIAEAKRIKDQTGCTWTEALTAACKKGTQP